MNKNNEKSLMKKAFEMYKQKFQTLMLPLSIFSILCFAVLAGGIFSPGTLIITIPFIIIPGLFAISAVNCIATSKDNSEVSGFLVMFRNYFRGFFRGCYRVIIGFLKALLTGLIVSSILSTILTYTVLNNVPEYQALINQISETTDFNVIVNDYLTLFSTNATCKNVMFVISSVSFLCGLIMFLHHFSKNGVKLYHNFLTTTPIPMHDLNIIHKVTFKKIRKAFNKDYYSSVWFLLILVILGFAGFSVLAYFLLSNLVLDQITIVGLIGVFVVMVFFIPYYFNVLQLLYQKYSFAYIDTFVELSLQSIDEIKKSTEIDPEREKQIREFLDATKKQNDKNKDEENK